MLDFDDVLVQTGEFGRYQKFAVWLLVTSGAFMNAYSSFGMVFVLFTPEFRCKLYPNDTDYLTVPQNVTDLESWAPSSCSIDINNNNSQLRTINCPYGYVYDSTYFESTIITEWDYVCDKAVHPRTVLSMMTLSSVIGDYVLGYLQDRFGRKFGFTLGTSMYVVFGIAMLWAPNLWVFGVLGAAQWFPGSANYNAAYVWALEYAGPSKRTFVTAVVSIIYALAAASMALIAYLFRTWQEVLLVITVPFAITLLFYWLIAESPRWLLSKGRYNEFRQILTTIARWDRKPINHRLIEEIIEDNRKASESSTASQSVSEGRTRDLFTRVNLRKKTLIITFAWCINGLVYYVISYNVENLGGNFYVAYALQAIIEAPASLLTLYTVNRYGRVPTLFVGLILSSITSLLSTPGNLWPSALIISFAVVAKFGISLSYNVLYQVAAELYPTVVRGRGLGFSTLVSDGLSVVIPYVVYSATDYQSAPMIILGVLCFFGAFSVIFLPETINQRLIDTIDESELLQPVSLATVKNNFVHICCPKRMKSAPSETFTEAQTIPVDLHM